jgi:hypothetical protein
MAIREYFSQTRHSLEKIDPARPLFTCERLIDINKEGKLIHKLTKDKFEMEIIN